MKKIVRYTLIVLYILFFAYPGFTQFQPTPVVKSQEKTIVNGKIFYIHTVQKGQTLYSISKAYEVTQEEIKNANPQVDVVNLVEGLAIRIPASTARKEAALYPSNKEDFNAHSVKRKETVYSIARKYRVDTDVIYYYNPWAKDGIRQDQTIWIPKKSEMKDISEEARKDDAFYYYTIKPGDTLYSIAKTYGVNVSDIIDANPDLKNGLRPDQTIMIPRLPTPSEVELQTANAQIEPAPCSAPTDPGHVFTVAVMLPFFSSHVEQGQVPSDSLTEEGTYSPQLRDIALRGKPFAEFYEGFLLAVDSLKRKGVSVNLHVFDTERDTNKLKRILRDLVQVQPDLIIGPVYGEEVNIAGRFANYHNINLISPLSTRSSLVNTNSKIVQVFPSKEAESYAMANHLRQFNKGRIILVTGTDPISLNSSRRFKESLLSSMPVNENGEPLFFKEYKLNDSLLSKLGVILSKEEENLMVVFSDKEAEVNSLVTRLIQRAPLFPVVLFGMPSWQAWTNIDLTFLHTLQLHIISPFHTDFSNKQVKNYLKRSRNHYGYEPYEVFSSGYNFSMLGYDLGLYFLSALKQYGRNFMPCIDNAGSDQLITSYRFGKTFNGGYVNQNFNLILYRPDFTVEKAGTIEGSLNQQSVPTDIFYQRP